MTALRVGVFDVAWSDMGVDASLLALETGLHVCGYLPSDESDAVR